MSFAVKYRNEVSAYATKDDNSRVHMSVVYESTMTLENRYLSHGLSCLSRAPLENCHDNLSKYL